MNSQSRTTLGGFSSRAANYGHAHITNRTIWTFLNEVHVCALNGLTSEVTAQIVHCSLEPPRQSERSLSCINLYIFQRISLQPNYEIYNFLFLYCHIGHTVYDAACMGFYTLVCGLHKVHFDQYLKREGEGGRVWMTVKG